MLFQTDTVCETPSHNKNTQFKTNCFCEGAGFLVSQKSPELVAKISINFHSFALNNAVVKSREESFCLAGLVRNL